MAMAKGKSNQAFAADRKKPRPLKSNVIAIRK